jgi:hypothetical protein
MTNKEKFLFASIANLGVYLPQKLPPADLLGDLREKNDRWDTHLQMSWQVWYATS